MDIAPFYPNKEPDEQTEERYPEHNDLVMTQPKTQDNSSIYPDYMLLPQSPDFWDSRSDDAPKDNVDMETQAGVLERLIRGNSWNLTKCEKKAYDLLIKLEKEITWEILLKIKTSIFLTETDNAVVVENPYLNADFAR